MKTRTRAAAAVLALAALTVPAADPATARGKPGAGNPCAPKAVTQTRQRITAALEARAQVLRTLAGTLDSWTHVTSEHRAVLNQVISTDQSALAQLNGTLARESDCRAVQTDGTQLVSDFRVYSLVLPQTYLTLAADTGAYGAGQLVAAEPGLRDVVEKVPQASRAQAQALWIDLVKQAALAQQALTPVGDAVLRLGPADLPSAAGDLGEQVRAVTAGSSALSAATEDAERLAALAPG